MLNRLPNLQLKKVISQLDLTVLQLNLPVLQLDLSVLQLSLPVLQLNQAIVQLDRHPHLPQPYLEIAAPNGVCALLSLATTPVHRFCAAG